MTRPTPARPPRRQRWVILVGGTPGPMGYVGLADKHTHPHRETVLATRADAVAQALARVRARRGAVPVCVWRAGGRWPARSPTWWFDPRGLPKAWAPRGAPVPKHPLPPCTCAEYGRRGDATPTRTCSVCGGVAVGGVRP